LSCSEIKKKIFYIHFTKRKKNIRSELYKKLWRLLPVDEVKIWGCLLEFASNQVGRDSTVCIMNWTGLSDKQLVLCNSVSMIIFCGVSLGGKLRPVFLLIITIDVEMCPRYEFGFIVLLNLFPSWHVPITFLLKI